MELRKYHLVLVFCIVHYRDMKRDEILESLPDADKLSATALEAAIPQLTITGLWGHNNVLRERFNGHPIPAGVVNKFITKHDLGGPMFHAKQFYRLADDLAECGWLVGGDYRFVPLPAAEAYVHEELDNVRPIHWPERVDVIDGHVVNGQRQRV